MPGTTSWVPASSGTQNEWITEAPIPAEAALGRARLARVRRGGPGSLGARPVAEPRRAERQVDRAVRGDVELVRREDLLLRVVELPPPLVAEHVHLEHVALGLGGEVPDRGDRGHGHAGEDDRRQDRPRDLQARVPVHLRGDALAPLPLPVPDREQDQEALDQEEDHGGDPEDGHEQVVRLLRVRARGFERGLRGVRAQAAPITARAERPRIVPARSPYPSERSGEHRGPAHCSTAPQAGGPRPSPPGPTPCTPGHVRSAG